MKISELTCDQLLVALANAMKVKSTSNRLEIMRKVNGLLFMLVYVLIVKKLSKRLIQ